MAIGRVPGTAEEDSEEAVFSEINITPLTDIFLVLLIIFMITTSVMIESAAKVNLPKATQTTQEARGLTVTITADNKIYVNQMLVDPSQLEPTLRDLLTDDPKKLVILQGDQSVILGEAVRVMDLAKRAGAQAISIAARKESAPSQ
jgi:biopolymer transport protein ExbD